MAIITRLEEQTVVNALEDSGANTIDEINGIIRNVLVCGFDSANKRHYPEATLRRDFAKYENAKVNFDHCAGPRAWDDGGGWISNVKPGRDGRPRGDLNIYLTDRRAPKVFEAARRNPKGFGLSHVAMCETRYEGGIEIVESIQSIESVDIVSDPATVDGLFESKGKPVAFTNKMLAEWVAKNPKSTVKQMTWIKRLNEMDDSYAGASMAAPADGVEPDEAIKAGVKAAINGLVDKAMAGSDEEKTDCLKKIKNLVTNHGTADKSDEPEKKDEPSSEGKVKPVVIPEVPVTKTALQEAVAACDKAKFRPDGVDLDMIAFASAERRPALIERLKLASESTGAEKVIAAGRNAAQLAEAKLAEAKDATKGEPPQDGVAYAKWLQE